MTDYIHLILTGGTIEKVYDSITEKPQLGKDFVLPDYLQTVIKLHPDLSIDVVSCLDSLDLTDAVRADIVEAINRTPVNHIVVVHGTSTMAETAQYIAQHLKTIDKIVVLTGAMIPLKEFAMSDGGFNLGYAMAQAQNAPPGVYVAMNARLFKAGAVRKNTAAGRFESV